MERPASGHDIPGQISTQYPHTARGRNISVEFPIPSLELFSEVSGDEDANDLTKLKKHTAL